MDKTQKRTKRNLFTIEQEQFIKKNVVGIGNQELTDLVNKKYGLSITRQQIKTWKKNRKLSSGITGYFEKGHEPVNKGTKGMFNVGGNKTSFKKGHKPKNYRSVGSERLDKDGYMLVKVQDHGTNNERWRAKHRLLWEEHNGSIPKGHKIIFLNQNKQDIRLENLALISSNEMARMNQSGWFYRDPEATKVGINLAKIKTKIVERKREKNV